MFFRRSLCSAVVCCLLLGGCADSIGEEVQGYVVQPQDTLYSIAWRHNLDFRDLARWNNIGSDYRISIGQVLTLSPRRAGPQTGRPASASPQSGRFPNERVLPATPSGGNGNGNGNNPHIDHPGSDGLPGSRPPGPNGQHETWVWPTAHDRRGVAASAGGILIAGVMGQEVRAASGGRVVYTGGGIRGYGNLIIIKHDNSLLSAYAHNREMLVREGQDVAGGQPIARMGEGAHGAASLYFEIRQNGRPVDPLRFLSIVK